MSLPKQRLPGVVYGVSVRCARRLFRLVPTRKFRARAGYVLARHARRHRILLHAYCFMSNHLHLVLTDPRGRLGAFMQDLDAALARIVNRLQGERGQVFERYEAWILRDYAALVKHAAYVTLNPVAACAVRSPEGWPGLVSLPRHVLAPESFNEPPEGISGWGHPERELERERLELRPPAGVSREQFAEDFAAALAERLPAALAKHSAETVYLSREALARIPHTFAPRTEPGLGRPPRIAGASEDDRDGLREFQHAYRGAMRHWRAGRRARAIFPPGTDKMVRLHGARVAPP